MSECDWAPLLPLYTDAALPSAVFIQVVEHLDVCVWCRGAVMVGQDIHRLATARRAAVRALLVVGLLVVMVGAALAGALWGGGR